MRAKNSYLPAPSFGERWEWYERPSTPNADVRDMPAAGDEKPGVAACLWVPDPEQRHGWREFYVYHEPVMKPGRRLGL